MKAVQLLLNSQLPPDLRDYTRELDSKSIGTLMVEVARKYPDQYERISKAISDIGRKASYFQGESLTLNDNRPVFDKDKLLEEMDNELEVVKNSTPDNNEFEKLRLNIWDKYNNKIQKETSSNAILKKNNLAYSVLSGARGKPPQLKMMISTPGLYTDADDNIIPLFVRRSFGEGLRPAEYLAGTYGARKSVLCLQQDTLVRMANFSCMPIKNIEAGMFVMGADKEGNIFPVKVIRKYDQGLQPVSRYTFKRGVSEGKHEVVCTKNHAILMNDVTNYTKPYMHARKYGGTFPDKSLLHVKTITPVGQGTKKRAAVLAGACTGVGGVEEKYALLLGLLTGDGSVCNEDLRLRLSCADERMIADLQPYMTSLGLKISDRRTVSNYDWEIVCADYSASFNTSIQKGVQGFVKNARMAHKQILIQEGLAWHRAETKILPININKWDNESVLAYISGILATDGSIYFDGKSGKPAISFAMTAKDVIFGLHDILRTRFGIYSGEISYRTKGGFGDAKATRKNVLWEFSITADYAVKQLLNILPAIPGIKEERRNKAKQFELKQDNPYPKARINNIQFLGMEPCFDIEVEHPDHLFVLESGIIVSNSTKRATAKGGDLCLAKGTLVRMANGYFKEIQNIVIGDTVLGSNKEGDVFPVKVVNTFEQGFKSVVNVVTSEGIITCTEDHKFLFNNKTLNNDEAYVAPLKDIDINETSLVTADWVSTIYEIIPAGTQECFDIEVDHPDHLFVLANGVVTSNSKQMVQSASHLVITENDCGAANGLDFPSDDKSLKGRVLARETGGMPAGTVLDKQALGHLRKNNVETLIVRSPMTCQAKEGICSKCMGLKPDGKFHSRGESIGITSSQAIGEPLCLHEDTLVRMADWTTRKIKDIKVGEFVLGSDINGLTTPVKVLNVFHNGIREGWRTTIKKGKGAKSEKIELISTKEHKVLSYQGHNAIKAKPTILPIQRINKNRQWVYLNNEYALKDSPEELPPPISRCAVIAQEYIGDIDTWDIEVDNDTHLFVLANGLVVSNTQMALNTKHQGGVAGSKKEYSGFNYINQFVQTPDTFPDKAVLAKKDGQVNSIIDAPQGGYYLTVDNEPHYIAPGYPLTVKVGDKVEAGDIMSDGLADPGEVVELRGLGEGRKYYADRLKKLLDDTGMTADRRNTEVLARAALDHLQIMDSDNNENYLPDDVISYTSYAHDYTPPVDTTKTPSLKSVGSFLQNPALHYTLGTRITPKIAEHLDKVGFKEIFTSKTAPTFKAHMPRLRTATHHKDDWIASMHTSYLKKQLNESAIRGEDSNVESNIHFAPRLAIGQGFGDNIEQTGKF